MSFLDDIFGKTPEVAKFDFKSYDFGQAQLDALLEDIKAWPKIEELGQLYQDTTFRQLGEAGLDLKTLIGLGSQTTATALQQAQQMEEGQVPQDVQDFTRRGDALTALLSGGPGGPIGLTARDLGLKSLDLITQGANLAGSAGNAAQRWQQIAQGTMMSPAGFLVTPAQIAQQQLTKMLLKRQQQQDIYNAAAAPDPFLSALNKVAVYALGQYLGHGMGGGQVPEMDASKEGAPVSASENALMNQAFGSQVQGLFPGTDDYGNPLQTGGGGGGGPTGDIAFNNATFAARNPGFQYGVGYPSASVSDYYGGPLGAPTQAALTNPWDIYGGSNFNVTTGW